MWLLPLLACAEPPPPEVRRPTLLVAVPTTGEHAALGRSAAEGVRHAVGDALAVTVVDDADPAALAAAAADPMVVGAVAHLDAARAEAALGGWLRARMPVLTLVAEATDGYLRALPPPDRAAACAAALLGPEPLAVRTDPSPEALTVGRAIAAALPGSTLTTVDPAVVPAEAERVRGAGVERVAWVGAVGAGATFLRLLREQGSAADFVAVGHYDPAWLQATGRWGWSTRVTSPHRPVRDPAFPAAWAAAHPTGADAVAVDAHEAARLLLAAWEVAAARGPADRAAVAAGLPTALATGASGSLALGPDGWIEPLACASFHLDDGRFVLDRVHFADEAMIEEAEKKLDPRRKRRRPPEGEWLRARPPASQE